MRNTKVEEEEIKGNTQGRDKIRNLKVRWQGCKKYSRLGGRDERLEILKVSRKG